MVFNHAFLCIYIFLIHKIIICRRVNDFTEVKALKYIAALIGIILACQPVSISALSTTPHGYGQGKITDNCNRPIDAVNFNSQNGKYDAYALSEDDNCIILTFDQGYENGYTSKILDTLKEKNVHAIFFLTGDYAKKETALVQRMIDEGHALGNHGMKHQSFPKINENDLNTEITSLHEYVLDKYNYEMQYLRPPCGEFSENSLKITKDLGYKTIMWSFAYVDWKTDSQPNPDEALKNAVSCSHGGAIYLLHSVSETNSKILGSLIDELRAKGYQL